MSSHDTEAGPQVDNLSSEDVKLVKTFLRTFESIAAKESAPPDKVLTERQSSTPAFNANKDARSESIAARTGPDRVSIYNDYMRISDDLKIEVSELLLQLHRVGGHETPSIIVQLNNTNSYVSRLDEALSFAVKDFEGSMDNITACLRDLQLNCSDILKTLYHQNHAFKFLQRLVGELGKAQVVIDQQPDMNAKSSMVFREIIPQLNIAFHYVTSDFRSFSDKTLPKFVIEEEERATTRYLTLTTIATFFSSITATTLQFSFQGEISPLNGVVHLFWYLSLVFSVSSGINSLLSMLWRKSAVYSEHRRTPQYIKLWFTNSPIVFLAISAFAFIIGLSLFVYSSDQPAYVATTTIGFTVLHILGILISMSWFQYRLNWSTFFIQSLRRNILWAFLMEDQVIAANRFIGTLRVWPPNPPRPFPSPFVRLIRCFMNLIRVCIRGFKRYLLEPLRVFIKKHLKRPSKEKNKKALTTQGDLEKGHEYDVNYVIQEFYGAWGRTFTGPEAANEIKNRVDSWKRQRYPAKFIDIALRSLLWGYPDLLHQFQKDVLPAMEAQERLRSDPMSGSQVSQAAGDKSHANQSPSGPMTSTVEAGGPGDDKVYVQSPSKSEPGASPDAAPLAESLGVGRATWNEHEYAARDSSSPFNTVEEIGSEHGRREEGSEKKSLKAAETREGLSRRVGR